MTTNHDTETASAVLWAPAYGGKYKVGDKVRTNSPAAPLADIVRNLSGDYFIGHLSQRGFWYGRIWKIEPRREDGILVSHNHRGEGDFVAWYKPEDVIEGW